MDMAESDNAQTSAMAAEKPVWNGSPSQLLNFPVFLACGLTFWLVFPLFIAIWKWLVVKNIRYELTTERLRVRYGVLNKALDELELYRVRDYRLEQPLVLRLFSLGNVTVTSTDISQPVFTLRAIRDSDQVREHIRYNVEECRSKKRVRAIDMQ
jgi:uncharacterized membrane protein YdbT with pleckstrin-like domain